MTVDDELPGDAFPLTLITPVMLDAVGRTVVLALRDGFSGQLMSQLLDPHLTPERERFYAASFAWAGGGLPPCLKGMWAFDFFMENFTGGFEHLGRLFPDSPPIRAAVNDLRALVAHLHGHPPSLAEHRQALASFRARLTDDFEKTSGWFAAHPLEARTRRLLERLMRHYCARFVTADELRAALKTTESALCRAIRRATQGTDSGCHHPDSSRDRLVQSVISYLARPGVVFSIHNACSRLAPVPDRSWLYDWCHRHAADLRTAVDLLRATTSQERSA